VCPLIACHLPRVLDEKDEPPEGEHNVEDFLFYYNRLYVPELFRPLSSPDFMPVFLWVALAGMDVVLSLSRLSKCDLEACIHNLALSVTVRDLHTKASMAKVLLDAFHADYQLLFVCSCDSLLSDIKCLSCPTYDRLIHDLSSDFSAMSQTYMQL